MADGETDRDAVAAEKALDRLWRREQLGEPPGDHLAIKRDLLNRLGVTDDEIEAMIQREIKAGA